MSHERQTKQPETKGRGRRAWLTRENVLMAAGIALVVMVFITAEEGRPFHYEFLILAGGMMGLGIAQWGDRRSGK